MTIAQSSSPLWFVHRRGRITASKAYDVVHRDEDNSSVTATLLQEVISYTKAASNIAYKWNLHKEKIARGQYIKTVRRKMDCEDDYS